MTDRIKTRIQNLETRLAAELQKRGASDELEAFHQDIPRLERIAAEKLARFRERYPGAVIRSHGQSAPVVLRFRKAETTD